MDRGASWATVQGVAKRATNTLTFSLSITYDIFHRTRKNNPKIYMEP